MLDRCCLALGDGRHDLRCRRRYDELGDAASVDHCCCAIRRGDVDGVISGGLADASRRHAARGAEAYEQFRARRLLPYSPAFSLISSIDSQFISIFEYQYDCYSSRCIR